MQKIIIAIVGIIIIIAGAWYFISSNKSDKTTDNKVVDIKDVVAVVNGEEISPNDLEIFKSQIIAQQNIDIASMDEEKRSQFETQIIESLVSQTLLQQAVNKSGIAISQEDIDTQINATITQLGGEEKFQQALDSQGLSKEAFRTQINADLATQTYLERELNFSSITATNEEIEALYAQAVTQNEDTPPLEDVRAQVEQSVIQQKQRSLFTQFVEELRTKADIEIFI